MSKIWNMEEEAANLAQRFNGVRRTVFARDFDVPGGAAMIYQHINGVRPISLEAAIAYAKGFGCSLAEISPRLAQQAQQAAGLSVLNQDIQPYPVSSMDIPLMNVYGSAGPGTEAPNDEVVVDMLRVTKSWVDKCLPQISKISNLAFIHASGDSMMPTFNDGDILLVDTGNLSIKEDKIYVLYAHDRLFIKRIRQTIHGVYEISSDNPAVKTVDVLNGGSDVEIKGRVVWVWNGKRV